MKNKGFTLIELLAVIVIMAIIMLIATPLIVNVINDAKKGAFKNAAYGLVKAGENEYMSNQLKGVTVDLVFRYENGKIKGGKDLSYKGKTPKGGEIVVRKDGKISIAIHNEKWCAIKKYETNEVDIIKYEVNGRCKLPELVDMSGANAPVLVSGMTPIKWDGTNWVEAQNINDPYKQDWYNYSEKRWANVKTADGSFWVWIPRYAYQISSGYHASTVGNIEIKFLKNKTNIASDGTTIEINPTYNGNSQINYVKHPAFKFGNEDLSGFWVAKFEPSGTENNISILPNAGSLRGMKIGEQFDVSLAMKSNSKYGWNSSEIDTHMMKNTEWGAVAYLSKSIYGANSEVWKNNSSTYTTGCAGNSITESSYSGCQNQYYTQIGQNASTTHNIYGMYDMSGGAYENVAAYVNNGNSNLTTNGPSVINANAKYKNVYTVGLPETSVNNYEANKNIFGDAVYETSSSGNGTTSWYSDGSYMPYSDDSWFVRGGHYSCSSCAGVFNFYDSGSGASFRPVVITNR